MGATSVAKTADCEQKWQSSGQPAGLAGDDRLDLDLVAAVAQPHAVGEVGELAEALVGERLEREHRLLVQTAAVGQQRPLRLREDVGARGR